MEKHEIEEWISRQYVFEAEGLDSGEIEHVARCMSDIVQWYRVKQPILGGFTRAVVLNDFVMACRKADDVNLKALRLYALFVTNCLPVGYRKLAQEQYG